MVMQKKNIRRLPLRNNNQTGLIFPVLSISPALLTFTALKINNKVYLFQLILTFISKTTHF